MIVCPKCSRENGDEVKFCRGCGQALRRIDPNRKVDSSAVSSDAGSGILHRSSPSAYHQPSRQAAEEIPLDPTPSLSIDETNAGIQSSNFANPSAVPAQETPPDGVHGSREVASGSAAAAVEDGFVRTRKLLGWLVTFSTDPRGEFWRLHEGHNHVGSGQGMGIRIDHPSVALLHATILGSSGRLFLRDELAGSGTFLNGSRLDCESLPLTGVSNLLIGEIECIIVPIPVLCSSH